MRTQATSIYPLAPSPVQNRVSPPLNLLTPTTRFGNGNTPTPPANAMAFLTRADDWLKTLLKSIKMYFNGETALFKRYHVDPKAVEIVNPKGYKLPIDKEELVAKALEAHEMGYKNQLLGNFSNRFHATNMLLQNGTWETATILEFSREHTLCGERAAITTAWNRALKKLPIERFKNPAEIPKLFEEMRAKMMVVSSGTLGGAAELCTECENWLSSSRYFKPDTLIVKFMKDKQDGKFKLYPETVQDRLPFWGKYHSSLVSDPTASLRSLKIDYSPSAQKALESKGPLLSARLKNSLYPMLESARKAYNENKITRTADYSEKNSAASVLFTKGPIATASRFDWSMRWLEPPDLRAAANGYQKLALQYPADPPRIEAVAYYGQDPNTPSIPSLGRFAQPTRGGHDTLVALIEDNQIKVRTIQDYQPRTYMSDFKLGPNPHV